MMSEGGDHVPVFDIPVGDILIFDIPVDDILVDGRFPAWVEKVTIPVIPCTAFLHCNYRLIESAEGFCDPDHKILDFFTHSH